MPVDREMAGTVLCRVPMRRFHWSLENLCVPRVAVSGREVSLSLWSGGSITCCIVSMAHPRITFNVLQAEFPLRSFFLPTLVAREQCHYFCLGKRAHRWHIRNPVWSGADREIWHPLAVFSAF